MSFLTTKTGDTADFQNLCLRILLLGLFLTISFFQLCSVSLLLCMHLCFFVFVTILYYFPLLVFPPSSFSEISLSLSLSHSISLYSLSLIHPLLATLSHTHGLSPSLHVFCLVVNFVCFRTIFTWSFSELDENFDIVMIETII